MFETTDSPDNGSLRERQPDLVNVERPASEVLDVPKYLKGFRERDDRRGTQPGYLAKPSWFEANWVAGILVALIVGGFILFCCSCPAPKSQAAPSGARAQEARP